MRPLPILAALVIAGAALPAASQDAVPLTMSPKLEKQLAGRTPGKPVSCISLSQVRGGSSTFANPDTIVYRASSRLSYVNQPAGGCNLRSDPIIMSRTPSTQLCRGDIITVLDRSSRIPVGSCGLGDFVPFTRGK